MIKYPNGKVYIPKIETKKKTSKASLSSANRGMVLEEDINKSNEYYLIHNIALITKRPTPINVVKVDYSKGARIVDAYFEKQSTTDYNGVYKGRYLDFEAKNTKNKTSFPLSNISSHQISHLKNVIYHGGIAFFIIRFDSLKETFLVDAKYVIEYVNKNDRKSISYTDIVNNGFLVKENYNLPLDYLSIVDKNLIK